MDQDAGGGSATDCGSRADGVRTHAPMCPLCSSPLQAFPFRLPLLVTVRYRIQGHGPGCCPLATCPANSCFGQLLVVVGER